MIELFYTILNMSISASILVLVVLLLRLLLRKAPKWMTVLLWGLAAIRLICPIAVESRLSLMPKTEWVAAAAAKPEAIAGGYPGIEVSAPTLPSPEITALRDFRIPFVLSCIWLAGMGAMAVYLVVSCMRISRRVSNAKQFEQNVYTSERIASPFVFGFIRPRIFLPESMDAVSMSYVIAHEEAHLRRFDHFWKPLGFLLLTVHWFNPLIWIGYILLCRDIEMACDERVIRRMNENERADYSEALLECSVNKKMITACPLAFGEVGAGERIKSVLRYKKPAFGIAAAAVIVCIAAAVCFLTNPQQNFDIASVCGVKYTETDVSDTYAQELISLIHDSSRTYFPAGTDDPNELSVSVQIDCEDGSMYLLHYQYYSGFSFHPAHPGEDDYRSILTYFSPDGKARKAWRLEYDFDAAFQKWLAAVRAEAVTPASPETNTQTGVQLTLDNVITLSAKGSALTWSDFAGYSHTDVGSGLYIWHLPIDEVFSVKVGGGLMMTAPMYVYLCAKSGDAEIRIDIRDGGVEEFVEKMQA